MLDRDLSLLGRKHYSCERAIKHTRLLIATVFAIVGGCAEAKDPYGRLELSGTVTFQGQPLDQGVIDFLPTGGGQAAGARAMIQAGSYTVPSRQGLQPNTYRVVITSAETNTTDPPAGPPGMEMPPPGKERIPPGYNTQSQVTIEVSAAGDNLFNFTIP